GAAGDRRLPRQDRQGRRRLPRVQPPPYRLRTLCRRQQPGGGGGRRQDLECTSRFSTQRAERRRQLQGSRRGRRPEGSRLRLGGRQGGRTVEDHGAGSTASGVGTGAAAVAMPAVSRAIATSGRTLATHLFTLGALAAWEIASRQVPVFLLPGPVPVA